ncbi:hypothetical protein PsorP6_006405 [Peronosclerospora sorghi]|uniref:Uncharacterized protein n=1 Tax=Peronosclerospora sorghi TaxID=230839 RepID=A0ACC0W687_9STRA|nr:hypothetical protein PsorP6_006405 [Peronosclerospora sorghi]
MREAPTPRVHIELSPSENAMDTPLEGFLQTSSSSSPTVAPSSEYNKTSDSRICPSCGTILVVGPSVASWDHGSGRNDSTTLRFATLFTC